MRKKLWSRIARHVVENGQQIHTYVQNTPWVPTKSASAMDFVRQSDLLKIEDVLPFFPDFVLIDEFKDAIVQSLRDYNISLDALQTLMTDSTESAESVRADIRAIRNQSVELPANVSCALCSYPMLTSTCYLFLCSHGYHAHCLADEVAPTLSLPLREELSSLRDRLSKLRSEQRTQW